MVRHFFLDKVNTIVKDQYSNMGLNPVMELNYGRNVITRGLIHFDENEILDLIKDKTFADLDNLSVKLKMTNCFSVDGYPLEKLLLNGKEIRQRAASFDIIAFKLPAHFDEGRGFDFVADFWINNNRSFNDNPSNWYFSSDGYVWPVDKEKIDLNDPNLNISPKNIWVLEEDEEGNTIRRKIILEGGVYSNEFLKEQYDLFKNNEQSIVIGEQHFDFGNENLCIDITKYIIDLVNGEENYGIGIMFSPNIERMETIMPQYVGFFTNNTNTFFHPYIEAKYCKTVSDDRENFCLGRENDLYLYSNINGEPVNLDFIPTCTIDGVEFEVQQAQKGVYFAHIEPQKIQLEDGTIGYDKWSNLSLNGQKIDDIELEFEVKPQSNFLVVGNRSSNKSSFVPSLYGINDAEVLHRGEVREITVDFRKEYETDVKELIDSAEYRLYIKDGNRELTVIDYHPIDKNFLNNFFLIYTADLVPHEYFVDIKVNLGREIKYFKKVLRFTVVSDVTERYE